MYSALRCFCSLSHAGKQLRKFINPYNHPMFNMVNHNPSHYPTGDLFPKIPRLILPLLLLLLTACTPQLYTSAYSAIGPMNTNSYKATAIVLADEDREADSTGDQLISASQGRATIVRAVDGIQQNFGIGETIIVEVGDVITAWEGKTLITFFDGHTTTLTPVSKIEVISMTEENGVETISLFQSAGSSANQVNQSASGPTEFDIETESSIAAVRGTDFNVQICGPEQTFYQTFEGSVEITKEEESVLVNAGFQTLATIGQPLEVLPLPVVPVCNDERVVLEYPLDGQFIFTSTIPIYGTATHENFDYWKLEYKQQDDPSDNFSFLYRSDEPVTNDLMTMVDVSHLANDDYILRLMTVDKTGNYPEPCTINIYLYPQHATSNQASTGN